MTRTSIVPQSQEPSIDSVQQSRISFDVAARMPPAWDTPEHKQQIYSAFERFQICYASGNLNQTGQMLRILRQLTEKAELRRQILLSEADLRRLMVPVKAVAFA